MWSACCPWLVRPSPGRLGFVPPASLPGFRTAAIRLLQADLALVTEAALEFGGWKGRSSDGG